MTYRPGSFSTDRAKLHGDWRAIGGDISRSMAKHRANPDKKQLKLFGDSW